MVYMDNSQNSISVNRLMLVDNTTIKFTDPKTGLPSSLNVVNSSVNFVKVKTGTRAGEFGAVGAGIGLVYILVSLPEDDFKNTFDRIMGYTLGGFAIGGLIGLLVPKYKNFYIQNENSASKSALSPTFGTGGELALGINITF
jgi:hypothetical protein